MAAIIASGQGMPSRSRTQPERGASQYLQKDLTARMRWRTWLKFYRYIWGWENYLLLARTWQATRLVKGLLNAPSPKLVDSIAAVSACYLTPQAGWRISESAKIYLFAHWMTAIPATWATNEGRCVQRSLIVYRLLNGYGIPARAQFGIRRDDETQPGHAWVYTLSEPQRAFGEQENPLERFLPVFTSALPDT